MHYLEHHYLTGFGGMGGANSLDDSNDDVPVYDDGLGGRTGGVVKSS